MEARRRTGGDPLMLWIEIAGGLVIGLALGVLGAGGSILTIPILVYGLGEPKKPAILAALAIVGLIAASALLRPSQRTLVDWRSAILLLVPGTLGAILGGTVAGVLPGSAQMILFAIIALVAAVRMFARTAPTPDPHHRPPAWKPILAGAGLGFLTGLTGVGGGFLIVPVLVLFLGLPMHRAVASSLVVIAGNCAIGFAKQWWALGGAESGLRWDVIAIFAACGVAGGFVGAMLSPRLPARTLRVAFGVLLLAVALGTLGAEVRTLLTGPPESGESLR